MSDMFGDFDPYQELMLLQGEVAQQRATLNKLIMSHNEQGKLLQEISQQFLTITQQNVRLHDEMARILARETK